MPSYIRFCRYGCEQTPRRLEHWDLRQWQLTLEERIFRSTTVMIIYGDTGAIHVHYFLSSIIKLCRTNFVFLQL